MNFHEAKRPVLIFGAGIHQGHAENEARELVKLLQIPVCLTWGACDLLPESNPLRIGTFGTHGTKAANFAVQNASHILSVGCRLDTKATGTPAKWFAREADIVMVDIDPCEIAKMGKVGVRVEGICQDAKDYITSLIRSIRTQAPIPEWWPASNCPEWTSRCQDWKQRYPAVLPEYEQEEGVNPYVLIRELSRLCEPGEIIVSDTGCTLAWCMQTWEFKEGQRFLHPMNQTPMGYGLPAAIGAHYATGKRVICVTGDGSIMMSIGELATIAGHNLPIKIVLLDNSSMAMCVQTENEWFDGKNCATTPASGLTFPNFERCIEGFGIPVEECQRNAGVESVLGALFWRDGPQATVFHISPEHDVKPKVKMGRPNEDAYPPLPREVMEAEMIVPMVGA
ncbi:MAG: thiamine pyrophosphate-dependent enzyme [Sulfuricaulis sp.]|nr:thiamine pyrophosphate-dependent enzyme [Sulfuricaulis sp.]